MLAVIPVAIALRTVGSLAFAVAGMVGLRRRRRERPEEQPVVGSSGLQLWRRRTRQADLDSDLRGADLHRARLRHLDLSNRDLTSADLGSARLDGANLNGARLDAADLSWASLRGCNLRGASLVGTQLVEADLRGASLQGADLSSTSGLETVNWRDSRANADTSWPASFDAKAAGVVFDRPGGQPF